MAKTTKNKQVNSIGIILAGGRGSRFQAKIPKHFMSLNGKLVIDYSIDALYESQLFDQIIVVIDKKYRHFIQDNPKITKIIQGGRNRNLSVANAIKYCNIIQPKYVVFHDAARPFVTAKDLIPYIENLKKYNAVITSQTITDALYHADRKKYKLIQTPEAFRFSILDKKFNIVHKTTAIYEHIYPAKIKFIELSHPNLKITYPRDIYIAEQLMKYSPAVKRTANLEKKDVLIIGGTGGIGRALTEILKKNGSNVTSIGSRELDLNTDFKSIKIIPNCLSFQRWDCIIHTAGAYATDSDGLLNNYDKIMNVNFKSIVYLVENAEALLKPNGSIICIGSTAAAKGRPNISLYSASKAALNCFVEAISSKLEKKNIYINVICPAKVNTPLQTYINPKADKKKMIQPDDLAKIIFGYIDYKKSGQIIYVRVGEE